MRWPAGSSASRGWVLEQDADLLYYQGQVDEQLGRLDQALDWYSRAEAGCREQNWRGLAAS